MQPNARETFDWRLREAVRISGKDQKEVARLVGISENSMVHYAKGRRIPKNDTVQRIAYICDVSPDWLILGRGKPKGSIGARLRTAREQQQWRPSDLAMQIGSTKEEVSKFEDEKEPPSDEWLLKVRAATGADLGWLKSGWDREGNYTPNVFLPAQGAAPPKRLEGQESYDQVISEPGVSYALPSSWDGAISKEVFDAVQQAVQALVHAMSIIPTDLRSNMDHRQVGFVAAQMVDDIVSGHPEKVFDSIQKFLASVPRRNPRQ